MVIMTPSILIDPIAYLPLSEELKQKLAASGFTCLEELTQAKFSSYRKAKGFSFHDELALFGFFRQHGLEEYWNE